MPRHPNKRADQQTFQVDGKASDDPNDKELGAPSIEEEPIPSDILPDRIESQRKEPSEEDEREITARPHEDFHPIPPNELP